MIDLNGVKTMDPSGEAHAEVYCCFCIDGGWVRIMLGIYAMYILLVPWLRSGAVFPANTCGRALKYGV